MEVLGYLAALIMGLSLGLIGGGGSILTVPILVYIFAQGPLVATTGSLFVVGSTALVGTITIVRKKIIDFKIGVLFAVPSFAGVFVARHYLCATWNCLNESVIGHGRIRTSYGFSVAGDDSIRKFFGR